jgi:hypothetical protein
MGFAALRQVSFIMKAGEPTLLIYALSGLVSARLLNRSPKP